jgi:cell division septation protein DedD
VAGGRPDRVSFGAAAVDLIAERSGGVPRIINLICDRSLHRGHLAQAALIDSDIVRVAMMDLGLSESASFTIPPIFQELPPQEDREDEKEDQEAGAADAFPSEAQQVPAVDVAISMGPSAPPVVEPVQKKLEPSAPADHDDCSFFFEARDTWTEPSSETGPRGWQSHRKAVALVVIVVALIAGAAIGRTLWKAGGAIVTAPEPPASPLESFALNFVPRRQSERAAVTPASDSIPPSAPGADAATETFVIDIALFTSSARATRLVADLTTARYRAYVKDLQLGDRGHLYQVKVGPFASRAAADDELARIHATPGYTDARVISSAP